MHIAFRVDSSTIIGYGHVMRCLTLARALSYKLKTQQKYKPENVKVSTGDADVVISFICRDHQGHINQLILDENYKLLLLPTAAQEINPKNSDSWLGTTFEEDAQQCINLLKKLPLIELLIVDHYAIDHQWHTLMRPYYQKLLVIDDLANRLLACDYLLDQTYNRNKASYLQLVPENCQLLLGKNYILLRDEFELLRIRAQRQRKERIKEMKKGSHAVNILITMGGTDPDNLSQFALLAIHELMEKLPSITVNLVISSQSIHLASLTAFCKEHPWANLVLNSKNMASLMLSADIAIGASGGTAWERCCLGLPCLTTINAENQQLVAKNLSLAGAIINLGWHQDLTTSALTLAINDVLNNVNIYEKMTNACFSICDGKGVARAVNEICQDLIAHANKIVFHVAEKEDCELIYRWQSNKNTRKYFINPTIPSWQEHQYWYHSCLVDPTRILYLLHDYQKNKVGLLRLDQLSKNSENESTYEISIIIAPEHQGKGLAVSALKRLCQLNKRATYIATIHNNNIQSQKAFNKAGFQQISPSSYQLKINDFQVENIEAYVSRNNANG
jgi:UDP-2,4-diacetamido-2,4,6-trideoxy-beta-L-altropyranose hydrolase